MKINRFGMLMDADDGLSIGGGAEESEVAEPTEEEVEGAEEQEVAEPDDGDNEPEESGKTSADAAFAELRRKNEALQKQLDEYDEALGYFFDGDNKAVQAKAFNEGRPVEEVQAEFEAKREADRLKEENEALQEQLTNYEVEQAMAEDLRAIQEIDPSVKALTDLPDMFFDLIGTGSVSGVEAYWAVKAKEKHSAAETPEPVGRVNESAGTDGTFTREQVEAMSPEEVSKNYDAIRNSMKKW